ncbi:peptide methionine sulfoxide reductase MsrA [Tsuneonella deserti]|uniref:Peptide methionine sulfoxide reductase MsrA n=1 Tax=Tsuneonella deserti TaxID=2035528 RepID=A0ABQ1SAP2_9SPHN|nr:peptide-methionine (S)-S-oxide reductase MsrA [Tsuneonella deserti]GGE04684.1 peptide methionine sulfoxide reductase MsrA [Tsuneonella deserti]
MKQAALALAAGAVALASCQSATAGEAVVAAPMAKRQAAEGRGLKTAVFAGGCFWGVEAVFSHVKGVKSAVSGYAGGTKASADYDTVSAGGTRHAEAVRVTYDPAVIRYDQLLRIYFAVIADPTLKNRQGPDVGAQYRTALFPQNSEQSAVARAYLAQLGAARLWKSPIVTTLEQGAFYRAEAYHQDFAAKNPNHPYIRRWDAPKVAALKATYPGVWKASFTTG